MLFVGLQTHDCLVLVCERFLFSTLRGSDLLKLLGETLIIVFFWNGITHAINAIQLAY